MENCFKILSQAGTECLVSHLYNLKKSSTEKPSRIHGKNVYLLPFGNASNPGSILPIEEVGVEKETLFKHLYLLEKLK